MKLTLAFAVSVPVIASAATIPVAVGQTALTFVPDSVTAAEGDVISFSFYPKNHSVTQSTFATPCVPLANGANSKFVAVASAATPTVWNYTVTNATSPLWFYCAQTSPASHCMSGMVFAVNPTANKTFAAFQAAAKASGTSASATATAPTGTSATHSATGSQSAASPKATSTSGALQIVSAGAGSVLAFAGLVAGFAL